MNKRVSIVEDDRIMRISLADSLRMAGYDVFIYESIQAFREAIKENEFDLVITDVRLPDGNGIDILKEKLDSPVIIMTAFGSIKDAVTAMKLGAFDYITKPFSLEEFMLIVQKAFEFRDMRMENIRLKQEIKRCYGIPSIIGQSAVIKQLLSNIERISASDSTVLIYGESGTGKELVATTIHYMSKRGDKPFIKVNCAAIPEGLVESELFGHEKGAFTGAIKKKPGRFELADGGTIFLDEIGDLPLSAQAKLLRVLQERTFERLGGTENIKVDVRIIAATNRDLKSEVKKGLFREDLFFRLNVLPIEIPPLRERREDIYLLVEHFLEKNNIRTGRNVRISEDALMELLKYDYPGNVRELENIIERCVTFSSDRIIKKEDLSFITSITSGENSGLLSLSALSKKAEKEQIIKILKLTGGNKTRAAEILGISRKTLWEKIKLYGIEV